MNGLIGQKLGMTEVFDGKGHRVAVTVIQAGPCVVIQRKTRERDGYDSVQLGYGDVKEKHVPKPALNRFKKANTTPKRHLREFGLETGDEMKEGDTVSAAVFDGVSHVDVSAISKGKGFQGVVRRHGMRGGPLTHGGHSKRRIGSIGQRAVPGNVAKDHHMPGHMGHENVTMQTLPVVELRKEENLILVNGSVPGPIGSIVLVRKALKMPVRTAEQKVEKKTEEHKAEKATEKKAEEKKAEKTVEKKVEKKAEKTAEKKAEKTTEKKG